MSSSLSTSSSSSTVLLHGKVIVPETPSPPRRRRKRVVYEDVTIMSASSDEDGEDDTSVALSPPDESIESAPKRLRPPPRPMGLHYHESVVPKPLMSRVEHWLASVPEERFERVSTSPDARSVLLFGDGGQRHLSTRTQSPHYIAPLTPILIELRDIVVDYTLIFGADELNQCIVNRYRAGEGIPEHVDDERAFGETIAVFTFGGSREIEFVSRADQHVFRLMTHAGSLYTMRDEARHQWTHAMRPQQTTTTIFSVTFRSIAH